VPGSDSTSRMLCWPGEGCFWSLGYKGGRGKAGSRWVRPWLGTSRSEVCSETGEPTGLSKRGSHCPALDTTPCPCCPKCMGGRSLSLSREAEWDSGGGQLSLPSPGQATLHLSWLCFLCLVPDLLLPRTILEGQHYHCAYFFIFGTRSYYVAQADLELVIFLLQPPKCWDYSCVPPHLACCAHFVADETGSQSLWITWPRPKYQEVVGLGLDQGYVVAKPVL
jgi:hypothetical protein